MFILSVCADTQVDDPELVDLVLRRELAPQLVAAPVYAHVTKAVAHAYETQRESAPPHLLLDTVLGQLQEAGLQVTMYTVSTRKHSLDCIQTPTQVATP
jgi:hypothetical protein